MNDARNVTQQREQDVQPEGTGKTDLEKDAKRWQQNREDDADKVHQGLRQSGIGHYEAH